MRTQKQILHILFWVALTVFSVAPVQAFHFPWDQGHDTFKPLPPDESQEPECPDEDCRPSTDHPVDIGAGDKIQRYVDFSLPGLGPNLELVRTYHSQDLSDGPFGFGWHTNLTTRLLLVTDGESSTAIVVQGDGKRKRFTQSADGGWESAAGTYQTLAVEADGSAVLRDKNGKKRYFNRTGGLTQIVDRNNNILSITYDDTGVIATATGASGRTLTFTKGADGRIASLADPLGRIFQYFYDANGYMVRVVDPMGGENLYGYQADSNLQTVTDARGNIAVTLTYDDKDRVTQEVLADGATYRFEYLSDTQTRVTNPRGYKSLYTLNATGQPLEILDPLGRVKRSTWDANYNRLSKTDGNGFTTNYAYDAKGNLLAETDALNQVTSYTYEPTHNQVSSKTDAAGNVTRYEYDSQGNLKRTIDGLGNETLLTYDALGQLISKTDSRNNITHYGYDTVGNLIGITDAQGSVTSMTYDVMGNLTSKTDAEGRVTRYGYDDLNRIVKIIDANNNETLLAYDANGNITSVTDPLGNITTYAYDSRNRQFSKINALAQSETQAYDLNGNLKSVTDISGNTTTYAYDAADQLISKTLPGSVTYRYEYDGVGNQTATVDPTGARVEQTFDANGLTTAVIESNGDKEAYQYDEVGNLIHTERLDSSGSIYYFEDSAYDKLSKLIQTVAGMGQTTNFGYDANGNLSSITDPLNRLKAHDYDAVNRLVQVTDAAGGITRYSYDGVGNLIGVSDPAGLVTQYVYDALNRRIQLDSPDTGITQTEYDANGNITTQTDSRGIFVTNEYDVLNRRIATHYPDPAEDRVYYYDDGTNGAGRLTGYDDDSGQTRFTYDSRGNILTESRSIQLQTYNISYAYDDSDRLTSLTYPSGMQVSYGYDTQGKVNAITANGQPIISNIAYLPFGPATSWVDGSSLSHTAVFDNDYRPTGITIATIQDYGYQYDAADNITTWNNAIDSAKTQEFIYDNLNRMTGATGQYGDLGFSYDSVGNRLVKSDGTATTDYIYASDSHRLQETVGAEPAVYAYDASGNLIKDDLYNYTYNQASRMTVVEQNTSTIATYAYNIEGQRVVKVSTSGDEHYVYDKEGHLIGVYDPITGAPKQEIVYFGDRPVATPSIVGTEFNYIHTDQLGTPRLVTDQNLITVWRWDSTPFGETTVSSPLTVFNLRFPGQYYDQETGLHQNYFRTYDPSTGRYITSDPIGLEGGLNTYLYVGGNPIIYSDPSGLKTVQCTKPLNALGGSGSRSGPDIWGNPFYHQYSCIVRNGKVECGGQDRGKDGKGKPSNDSMGAGQCKDTQPDNDCFEQCLRDEWAKPRPPYGIPFGTDCQEYDDDVNKRCRKKCKIK